MMGGTLKSMTGFAQARVERDGWAVRVNLRSVNHRFLDLHLRLPEGMERFEPEIRKQVRGSIRRGHVDVFLFFEAAGPAAVHLNHEVAAAYLDAANRLRKDYQVEAEPDLVALMRLPGVIGSAVAPVEEDPEGVGSVVCETIAEAVARLDQMREQEGGQLVEEMKDRLAGISAHTGRIEELASSLRPAYARRLEARIKELMGSVPLDPSRLVQEAALVAERGDISEELERLRSHVQQFHTLLETGGDIGKKLDFLLQEMQREANTLLSKTPGVEAGGLEITDRGLEVKAEIEKLREQVQNVE